MLKQTGSIIQINLLDRVIAGRDNWFSFREHSMPGS
ncbi:MAG: hypothetical protein MI702_11475 [Chlorobiales bacterium]|nr:hypothetical protein [Chlorobiales bacterium]